MSSLSSSLYTAVTALSAQSQAVSAISNNLANSETVGYKTTTASFSSLVTGSSSQVNFTGAGVVANPTQNIAEQGQIVGTDNDTDLAIDGDGFFVVTSSVDSDVYLYTRAGDFSTDDDGYLVNTNGYYLQGWPTDTDGNVVGGTSAANLEAINMNTLTGTASATTEMSIAGNMAATAEEVDTTTAAGLAYSSAATSLTTSSGTNTILQSTLEDLSDENSVTTTIEIFDSLGVSHTLELTYVRTGTYDTDTGEYSTWDVYVTDLSETSSGDSSTDSIDFETDALYVGTVAFDGDGLLAGYSDDTTFDTSTELSADGEELSLTIDIDGLTTGANDLDITYTLGTVGSTDGLTQYAPSSTDDEVTFEADSVDQDGVQYGSFYSATVDEDGTVYANFDNGISYAIYKIPLATFNNENGLEAVSGNAYLSTSQSGAVTYVEAGTSGSGDIYSGSLEESTVDTASEFSSLITAQQAYSAACEIVSAAQEMYEDIIGAKR